MSLSINESKTSWPSVISTADGEIVGMDGAMCENCGDLMEDHVCPSVAAQSRVRTYKKGKGNVITFPS